MKANISVYGLCEAPHAWYVSLKSIFEKEGAKKSKFDDSMFYLYDNYMLHVTCICYNMFPPTYMILVGVEQNCFS